MQQSFKFIFLVLFLFAVGCSKNKKSKTTESENGDVLSSMKIEGLTENFILVDGGDEFKIDESFMNRWKLQDSISSKTFLHTETLKILTNRMAKFGMNQSILWLINDLFMIDSLKKNDGYKAYSEGLDVGQTLDAFAKTTNRIKLSDSVELLVWCIHYTTMEACPYATGDYFLGTILFNNQIGETLLIAQKMYASDAPVGISEIHEASIKPDGSINIKAESINSEEGEPDEKTTKTFFFQIDKLIFQKISTETKSSVFQLQ